MVGLDISDHIAEVIDGLGGDLASQTSVVGLDQHAACCTSKAGNVGMVTRENLLIDGGFSAV